MVDVKYDQVLLVEIGFGGGVGQHTDIVNIVSFADRLVSRDGKHVDPINVVNIVIPRGVHHNQRHYEMELVLDSDNYEAFYTQQVQAAVASSRAIRQTVVNNYIEYFRVHIRESDGTQTTYAYESGRVWCVGQEHNYSNERGIRHNTTTFTFICVGNRSVTGW